MPKNKKTRHSLPREEWPYEVPGNWIWTQGASIFLPMEAKKPSGDFFSYIDIESIDNASQMVRAPKRIATQGAPSRANRKLHAGDTIFSLVRPYLRNIAYIDETLSDCIASTGFFVCRPIAVLNSRYIYWLMTSDYTVIGLNQHMKGDNSPSIRKGDIEQFSFPLPPLPEQQRIVERIESLFAKLDAAERLISDALEKSERLRACVLQLAFTGELTKGWRADHGVGMESWNSLKFNEVASIKCNLVQPSEFPDFPHIAPDSIEKYTGVLLSFNTVADDKVVSGKHHFFPGQILYSKIRPYLSKVIIAEFEGLCSADMYPIEAKQNTKYLWYYMLSDMFLFQASNAGSRSVLPKINQKELSCIKVSCPPLPEQREIVRILDAVFDSQRRAKEIAEKNLSRIADMKKSLLALAFRGQLGTNDPTEESMERVLLASS